jgi:hypothetical protein
VKGFGPATYGDGFADVYDQWYSGITDANATAAFVASRVTEGPVLELGVGSGRLVGPLQALGLTVVGVDASAAMLDRCRRQHPRTPLVVGDLANLPLAGPVGGALCAFNTLFNLPTAGQQQCLLATMASVLAPSAPLIVEAITGTALADGPQSSVGVSKMATDQLVLSATTLRHDDQVIEGQHVDITADGIVLRPWQLRWTTPLQLDDMAANVGLELVERHGGWEDEPFNDDAELHISVYTALSRHSPS